MLSTVHVVELVATAACYVYWDKLFWGWFRLAKRVEVLQGFSKHLNSSHSSNTYTLKCVRASSWKAGQLREWNQRDSLDICSPALRGALARFIGKAGFYTLIENWAKC